MWKAFRVPSVPITGELGAEIVMSRAVLEHILRSAALPPG